MGKHSRDTCQQNSSRLFRVRMNLPVSCFFLVVFSNGFYLGTEGSQASSRLKTRNDITSSEATPISEGPKSTSAISNECPCGIKGSNDEGDGRIVGGDDADVQEYPWQVGVEINGQFPWCGGSLISKTEILTAAHCVNGRRPSSIKVIVGENDISDEEQMKLEVAEVLIHPMYNASTYSNDFAILRLTSPLTFSSSISPVCLPADPTVTFTGEVATVTGWGSLGAGNQVPAILQEANVTVISNTACKTAPQPYKDGISETMLCAAAPGKDSCQGDSGGPLILLENSRQTLVGVVSWGVGCALPEFPGVYSRVTVAMDWILANSQGAYHSTCNVLGATTSTSAQTSTNMSEDMKNHGSKLGFPSIIVVLLVILPIFQHQKQL